MGRCWSVRRGRLRLPEGLADQCEIVFVSLPTLAAFRAVALGETA